MNANKTAEIFYLTVAETITDGRHGLSTRTTNHLAGCAGQHANNEQEFVNEVINQSENFTTFVESVIEKVEGEGGDSKETDLNGLKQMLGWTFDRVELEKMAREDWRKRFYN